MCGFLAAFGPSICSVKPQLERLGALLQHRGPDGSKVQSNDDAFFSFHRLAVQDIDPRSNQPMTDPSGRYTLVFNGEIYNTRQLRNVLARNGVNFRTSGDTEVLLRGLIND